MTAKYLTRNKQITFEITGESHADIFQELASIQEIFDTEHKCGLCGKDNLRFQHRVVHKGTKIYNFYHLQCRECHARFDFGQTADDSGALFPKRKDKNGAWLPNNGWSKYSINAASDTGDDY